MRLTPFFLIKIVIIPNQTPINSTEFYVKAMKVNNETSRYILNTKL